ncbi:MAG: sugar O-acetyltransferase [Elainellaceae cyanobacterium]
MTETEREKMLSNQLYRAADPELMAMRLAARRQLHRFNTLSPNGDQRRQDIVRSLLGSIGPGFEINAPFHCDYGSHIRAGRNLYINVNCTILDCSWVTLGDDVLIAPNVQIYTAYHPLNPNVRRTGLEQAAPITIGNTVWLGGGVVVCPGVIIGDDVTIGAGSVVTKDIPAGAIAVGNPCRVIRLLDRDQSC